MIKTYRLRSDTVQAILYDGTNFKEIEEFCNGMAYKPYFYKKGLQVFTLNTKFGECKVYPDTYVVRLADKLFIATKSELFHNKFIEVTG